MTRDILKSFGELAFYILIIVLVVYFFIGKFSQYIEIKRLIAPRFFSDILWYRARLGGFNLIDFAKLGAFAFLVWFPCTVYVNILSAKFFPPSVVAIRADIALTKLAHVEENDIRCFQIAPDCISIRHSARAAFPWIWYRENESAIELPVGVDFIRFEFLGNSEVRAYFQRGIHHKLADILIERPGGGLQVIRGNGGKYVYAIGDNVDLEKCEVVKIGFVDAFENISDRMKEAARWDSRLKNLIVAIPVNGKQDETAIHHKLEDSRLYDADAPGREIFVCTQDVKMMVQAWINDMQASRQMI